MTLHFIDSISGPLNEWAVHNVKEATIDSRVVQVAIASRCADLATVVHDNGYTMYVVEQTGIDVLFPGGGIRLGGTVAFAGIQLRS